MADEETKQPDYEPGTLASFDDSDQEYAELSPEAQQALSNLVELSNKRDMAARRWEVEQTWEARLFDRGYQYLLPRQGGGWQLPQEGKSNAYAAKVTNSLMPTNFYSPYGQIINSALTRQIPKIQWQPEDPENDGDITASEKAEDYEEVFRRVNDLPVMHTELTRYLWNDGRALIYTRHVKDAQRFGNEEPETPVVPETEGEGASQGAPSDIATSAEPAQGAANPKGAPRGQEVAEVFGKLEHKLPMQTTCLADCHFATIAKEYDISIAKGMCPTIIDKIQPESGPGENELDRIARINTSLNLAASYVTGDAMVKLVTVTRTWFRPCAFLEIEDKKIRAEVMAAMPDGGLVLHAGKQFSWARNENMDDHLTLVRGMMGDGQNTAGLGAWLIPIQKRVNNWVDLANDYFTRTVPRKYLNSNAFNIEALRQQGQQPGDIAPFNPPPGATRDTLMMMEDVPTNQPEMPAMIEKFINELGQLLSGGYPALSGGDTEGNDTASGISMQRDQALGRLGVCWHNIQKATANYHRQAVQCAARCRTANIVESVPGSDALTIELDDLKGNILCYPEADSNFPESWTERQGRFTNLLQDSKNPVVLQLLSIPKNLKVAKDAVGLQDFEIPQAESVDKQLGEFELLLKSGPMPNPQVEQLQQLLQQAQMDPGAALDPQKQQMTMQIQQAVQSLPPMVSTVPIDVEYDDHASEYQTCNDFINSPKGRKLKYGSDEEKAAFQNIRLHGLEHKQQADKQAAAAAQSAQKQKVSESMNFADLPIEGQIQMAQQAGIQLDPNSMMQQKQQEAAAKQPPEKPGITIQ